MITPVVMPQLGLEVTEGTVAAIHVGLGAFVAEGDALLELETDKALTDVVAPRGGVVGRIEVDLGDTVAVGATLILLADDAAELPAEPMPAAGSASEDPVASRDAQVPTPALAGQSAGLGQAEASSALAGQSAGLGPAEASSALAQGERASGLEHGDHGRPRSAPVARRAARQLGIELSTVEGTGPRGRITLADVERAAAGPPHADAAHAGAAHAGAAHAGAAHADAAHAEAPRTDALTVNGAGAELIPLTGARRAIARRMTRSQAIPQFSLQRELDATRLLADKAGLPLPAAEAPKSTINDMLVQALGEVVLRHPELAASYVEDESGEAKLSRRSGADVGLAVATDRGLMVPVIRGAHERSLAELAADRVRLVGAARSGRLTVEQMSGAAVTLSNLGAFGIDSFVAMLNPGEAAILAVGRIVERVVPAGRGLAVVPTLSLSLTIDHRVMDGASGAAALVELTELLEGAMTWRP